MENNKKGFMNIQLFGDEPTGATTPETQNTQPPEKDYKHEYEKQLMEIEKLKNAISKTNSENAEYKRKELEKMSDDEKKLGRPTDFEINIREVYLSAGAGFVVAVTGSIMTMPGLPKAPAAFNIDVDSNGTITGLF